MATHLGISNKLLLLAALVGLLLFACGDPDTPPAEDPTIDAADDLSDSGADDLVETSVEQGCEDEPGGFGCPCGDAGECDSGLCLPSSRGGSACTDACTDRCPDGWVCEPYPDDQSVSSACVEAHDICRPCRSNTDCETGNYGNEGDRCIDYGDVEGAFCGRSCADDDDCPIGFLCEIASDIDTGEETEQCVPDTDECGCSIGAIEDEASTDCARSDCTGERICTKDGLSDCSAATPSEDVCDGADNDCSGEVDEGFDDTDGDGDADCVDDDDDDDEIADGEDNCPLVENPDQLDIDEDGDGDLCDPLVAPELTGSNPASPANINTISILGVSEPLSVVQLFTDDACTTTVGAATVAAAGTGDVAIEVTVADNTTTTFWGATTSSAGQSPCSATSVTYVEDSEIPDPPTLSATDPVSPSTSRTPNIIGSAEDGATIRLYTAVDCTGDVAAEGSTADLESTGLTVSEVAADDDVTFYATAMDAAGNTSACSAGLDYTHDGDPPSAPVLNGTTPTSPSSDAGPSVSITAEVGTLVSLHTTSDCGDAALGTGEVPSGGDIDIEITVAANQETSLHAMTVDDAGNPSPCSTPALTYIHDDQPPTFSGVASVNAGSEVGSFDVSWAAASDLLTETADIVYEICATEGPIDDADCPNEAVTISDAGAPSYHEDSADGGRRYWIRVRARDQAGNMDTNQAFDTVLTLSYGAVVSVASGRSMSGDQSDACALFGDGGVACYDDDLNELFNITGVENATYLSRGSNSGQPDHFCVRYTDGTADCWGGNVGDHLGTGVAVPSDTLTPLAHHNENIITVEPIDGSTCSSYFVDGDDPNVIRCWGTGFGDANVTHDTPTPTAHRTVYALGDNCAIGPLGRLHCWAATSTPYARRVGHPTGSFIDIEGGRLALQANGAVYSWDFADADTAIDYQLGIFNATDIAASGDHACTALADGHVICWGSNADGQLTDNTPHPTLQIVDTGLTNMVTVSAGDAHSCAVSANGRVSCFGAGYGATPQELALAGRLGGTRLGVGGDHSCGLRSDGQAKCWGLDIFGQLGDGADDGMREWPARVMGIPEPGVDATLDTPDDRWMVDIATGENHTCAVMSDGSVFCWGQNDRGQLGIGSMNGDPNPTPQRASTLGNIRAVAAGYGHTCAAGGDGSLWCWGDNQHGQIGLDGPTESTTPAQVLGERTTHEVGVGDEITCIRAALGQVKCWGTGYGHASAQISDTEGSTSLAVGGAHGCATFHDGSAVCWGSNSDGQLGDGTTTPPVSETTSVAVLGISHLLDITAGAKHTCGLRVDGTVWCWGDNALQQLGAGAGTDSTDPVQVAGLPSARTVEAGPYHTCALVGDGTIWCWGSDDYGKCGGGNVEPVPVAPRQVQYFP